MSRLLWLTAAHRALTRSLLAALKGFCRGYSVIGSRCKHAGEIIHSVLSDSHSCLPGICAKRRVITKKRMAVCVYVCVNAESND